MLTFELPENFGDVCEQICYEHNITPSQIRLKQVLKFFPDQPKQLLLLGIEKWKSENKRRAISPITRLQAQHDELRQWVYDKLGVIRSQLESASDEMMDANQLESVFTEIDNALAELGETF